MAVRYWLKMLADAVIWHADEVVRSLKPTDYRFSLGATIKSYKAEKVAMHFVNVKINFELKTF